MFEECFIQPLWGYIHPHPDGHYPNRLTWEHFLGVCDLVVMSFIRTYKPLLLLHSYARSILYLRQTSIPRPYTIISLLSFPHCSSQPFQYPSVSSRAYTRLLNESIEKQTFTRKTSQPIGNLFCFHRPWLKRIQNKKVWNWLIIL